MEEKQIQISKYSKYIELLNKLLSQNKISAWNINGHDIERENFYMEADYKIESILEAKREGFVVNLYKEINDEIGKSTFVSSKYDSIEEFKEDLNIALFTCSQSRTKKYKLSKKEDKEVDDSHIDYDSFCSKKFEENFKSKTLKVFFAQIIEILKKEISGAQSEKINLKVNSCEFLNSIRTYEHIDSNKIDKAFKQNSSYFELIITAKNLDTNKENEFVSYEKINNVINFDFEGFFKNCILNAKNSVIAKQMKNFKGKVILSNTACKDFFIPDLSLNSVIGHCSARLKHQGVSKYKIGKEIFTAKKNKLTIYANAIRKNNSVSEAFDEEGISGQRTCLIKKNVVQTFFANKQYADYTKNKATGPLGVIEVNPGDKSLEELNQEENYVEIITFSSFVPDLVSGEFSSEIRQGYLVENGIRKPIKGGLLTGNIFKILENIELSKEIQDVPGYVGPKAIKFYDAEIVGL